jgi:pimeloyl-ACP methyl ester carboxylesterase
LRNDGKPQARAATGRVATQAATERPAPDELIRRWTEPVLTNPGVRRYLLAYARGRFDRQALGRDTRALRRFHGEALVLWSPDNRVMPPAHGRQLAGLLPRARYAQIPGAYVLSMLDQPQAVAREMGEFLTSAPAPTQDQRSSKTWKRPTMSGRGPQALG